MDISEAVAAALGEFRGQHVDVVLIANGEPEVGFYGYLAGSHSLDDETASTVLEFTSPDGRPTGGVTVTEEAFVGAEWRELDGGPLLAIALEDREVHRCRCP
jgi:hypothetical protein